MKNNYFKVKNMQVFHARKNGNEKQLLSEHLSNVADLSAEFSDYKNISRLVGILHDLGKTTDSFQSYLENGGKRGKVAHSLQGAFFVDDVIGSSNDIASVLVKEIVALSIMAHHGSLKDGISPDGETVFYQKLLKKDDKKYHYPEVKQNMADAFPELSHHVNNLINAAKEEVIAIVNLIQTTYKSKESAQFALGLFVKYLYSCLIDADRLDAYLFDVNEQYKPADTDWESLTDTFEEGLQDLFEKNIQKLGTESKIVNIRQSVSNQCREAATKSTGIYQLSVPTGGGKTLSSMRFALHHCKAENKKRIIYVIPYLSIIEQTALELRKILNLPENNNVILEHHSNIVLPDGEEEQDMELRKLATSRWDKTIIFTTMVQFMETVMSSKGSDLRKFHNMSDSVIIFDEIQSLPIKSIHLFNEAVSFLSKICNATVLLCTATQPLLDKTERKNLLLESRPDLIECGNLFKELKRTHIVALEEMDVDGFSAFISEKADACGNCLTIVNTKKAAREVFNRLKGKDGFEVYHLSTTMCSTHRSETITKVKDALTEKRKVICVATQLIEAGIDISFSCVVRALAGLDSMAQAAGRGNRNGESESPIEVYVIPFKGENLDKLTDIKSGKEITERLIRENEGADLLDPIIMESFYESYFYKRKNQMDYPTNDGESIYDMLSFNKTGAGNYKNRTGSDCHCIIKHAFRTADENFSVIDKNTESIVVLYGEAEMLIEAYHDQPKHRITKEKLDIIKKLEKFSISLYSWEMEKLTAATYDLDKETGIKILSQNHYSEDIGVILEADSTDYMI